VVRQTSPKRTCLHFSLTASSNIITALLSVQVNSNETLMATLLLSAYEVSHRKQEHRQTTDTLQSAINHQLVYKQEVFTAIMSMVVLLY